MQRICNWNEDMDIFVKVVLIENSYFIIAVPRCTMESSVIKPKETHSPAKHHLVLFKERRE